MGSRSINDCLGVKHGEGEERGIRKGQRKRLVMMDMSTIVIVVLVSRVYAYVKMYHIVQFRYVKFIVCQ